MKESTPSRRPSRLGPSAAVAGAILLFVGTWLHPMATDPNVPLAAFAEYAGAPHWVASHLIQLAGVVLIAGALVLLAQKLMQGPAAPWASLAMSGAVASAAVAAALQAVDGIALKQMVDRWAATAGQEKDTIFQVAFGVRQIEMGLAAITSLIFGLTASIYGIAMFVDRRFPRWLAAIAVCGGVPTAIAGVIIANTGFSNLAMALNLPSILLLIIWLILLGRTGLAKISVLKKFSY